MRTRRSRSRRSRPGKCYRRNPTENVYILRVDKVRGKLATTVIHTYPAVSQFWTYKPEEFLKSPPYTRDYPPAKP